MTYDDKTKAKLLGLEDKSLAANIELLEISLGRLYKILPHLPDNFDEIVSEMDSDDIIGHPESSEFIEEFWDLPTYRFIDINSLNDYVHTIRILWYDNKFVDDLEHARQKDLTYIIEVRHPFGTVALYKQGGVCKYISQSSYAYASLVENKKMENGKAGSNLVSTVGGWALEVEKYIEQHPLPEQTTL